MKKKGGDGRHDPSPDAPALEVSLSADVMVASLMLLANRAFEAIRCAPTQWHSLPVGIVFLASISPFFLVSTPQICSSMLSSFTIHQKYLESFERGNLTLRFAILVIKDDNMTFHLLTYIYSMQLLEPVLLVDKTEGVFLYVSLTIR